MVESFKLKMFTLEKVAFEGRIVSLVAPGADGYFGVLAHHAPLVAALKSGKLTTKDESGSETVYAVSGGFLEASSNSVVVLADAIERAGEIDIERAEAARERAARRIDSDLPGIDTLRAQAAFSRALNRIKIHRSQTTDYTG